MRSISTRFKLVEYTWDVIRKLYKVSTSSEVSNGDREKVKKFIGDTASEVSIGFGVDSWFERAVDLLSNLDVPIQEGEFSGLFGVDLEAIRGSIPDLKVLRGIETPNETM